MVPTPTREEANDDDHETSDQVTIEPPLQKKDTSVTFWAERIFFVSYIWHFYDDNCDKTRYHHRCGGLLLL